MIHVVNSLQFEVTCPDEEMSFDLRQNFAQTFPSEMTEVIEKVCSAHTSENESIKIDRIELDLGSFSRYSFGTDFKRILSLKFEQELTKELSKIPVVRREVSRRLSHAEILIYFLLNGTLPWWADETAISLDEICGEALISQPKMFSHFLYQNRFNEKVWKRISWQLNDESKKMVAGLSAKLKNVHSFFVSWIVKLSDKISLSNDARLAVVAGNINGALASNDEPVINNILVENATQIFLHSADNGFLTRLFKSYAEAVFGRNGAVAGQVNHELAGFMAQKSMEPQAEAGLVQTAGSNEADEMAPDYSAEDEVEKYSVKYAGVVLLAPFLKSFFSALGLLEDGGWKSAESAFRAVHLLKFLGSGSKNVPEYSLVLEKILCGLPVGTPIPSDVVLQSGETEEAETLLTAVITHWAALKNTSIEALRETFFKRDGLLTKKDGDWLLQVERKTFDVLLDQIPWGYGTISLSWNGYMVFVEW